MPGYSQLFDIQTFPTLYLLDRDKRIVAKKLTFEQMDEVFELRRAEKIGLQFIFMMRMLSLLVSACLLGNMTTAQTLMTYGSNKVDAKEFVRAYKRNNTDTVSPQAQSMRNYLDLFVNAKMKVKEAYARRYDTLPGIVQEVENLRAQLTDKYLADPVLLERLKKRRLNVVKPIGMWCIFSFPSEIPTENSIQPARPNEKQKWRNACSKGKILRPWPDNTPMTHR